MKMVFIIFNLLLFLTFLSLGHFDSEYEELLQKKNLMINEQNAFNSKKSDFIKNFLEHFKNPDSLNMPLPIPDPLIMQDHTYTLIVNNVNTSNVTVYGVSRIRLENFTSDIVEMKIHFGLRMSKLTLLGNYSYFNLFIKYSGRFNITVQNSYIECNSKLQLTRLGGLEVADVKMDLINHETMDLDIENAGIVTYVVKNFGEVLFGTLRTYIFDIISGNIRNNMNDHLRMFKVTFPNSIPPIDLAIAELRKLVRSTGLDPYYISDYQYASGIYSLDVSKIIITGLSSFYRVGDVKIFIDNHIMHVKLNIASEVLECTCDWEAGIGGILTKSGETLFTIDYIHIEMSFNQSLDISKKPKLVDLNIKIGNIQLRMDGAGTLDYIAEAGINVIPNLLRYQIIQAAEMPIRRRIQEIMDNTDTEQFILDKLPIIDQELYKNNIDIILEDNLVDENITIKDKDFDQEIMA